MENKNCITKYEDEETNANLILNNILRDIITTNFKRDNLYKNNKNIIFEEKGTTFTTTTNKILKNNPNKKYDLELCENILRFFHGLKNDDNLVIFVIDIKTENTNRKQYMKYMQN